MFISVKQVKSNLKNEFVIDIKGKDCDTTYTATTPWLDMNMPFDLENLRKLYFKDVNDNLIYLAKYNYLENTIEENIPFKFLFTGEQKFSQMSIYDNNNIECGKFYSKINGWRDSKMCVIYDNQEFIGYKYAQGSTKHISFYKGETQVAQIIKNLLVIDNLDEYYIFILDEYDYLDVVLSFFVIYFDYCKYRNSGELTKGKYEITNEYTYSKNNRYYNPNWIRDNFGEEELFKINKMTEAKEKEIKNNVKRTLKIIGIAWGVLLIFMIIFLMRMFMKN